MRVVDANVLLYAANEDAVHHEAARSWLDEALSGSDSVGFSWIALLAFMRLSTKASLFPAPLATAEACDIVDAWLAAPGAHLVHPGPAHPSLLRRLLGPTGAGGNLVNDAHLAALALERRADVVSYDADFARFADVSWLRPDELLTD